MQGQVRWGIIGTARIARSAFLPAVAEAGGVAAAVAGRDTARVTEWARVNGIGRAVTGYQSLIDDPEVDALYIPLPNALHAEWTIAALRAGKPVLCEKPLTGSPAETERVLTVAAQTGTPLWEAFVFPFHDQMARIRDLLAAGAIGDLREIQSNYHFPLRDTEHDIRMSAALAGGALYDVGCYPVWLARHLFAADPETVQGGVIWDPGGVDLASWGHLGFPGDRRLLMSCGFRRAQDTFSRLLGTAGQIHITNAFHPGPADRFEVHAAGRDPVVHPGAGQDRYSFTPAIRHIEAVVRHREEPRWLATGTSLGSARALADLAASAGQPD
ncbi:MAG TPA: Gfo/Idh/MocA family oxidoreductase [Streptosporangiaceae bacterium]|nr:Gfo/Idh/MocA family oxidoreductase [Streptosporangiaceae bacterium]